MGPTPATAPGCRPDDGFTLVELLVVVVIIGILAAIVVPVYAHQREKGVDASIKSDLRTVATALESAFVDHGASNNGWHDIDGYDWDRWDAEGAVGAGTVHIYWDSDVDRVRIPLTGDNIVYGAYLHPGGTTTAPGSGNDIGAYAGTICMFGVAKGGTADADMSVDGHFDWVRDHADDLWTWDSTGGGLHKGWSPRCEDYMQALGRL